MRPKYLDVIAGMFVAVLLISNVASTKIVALGPFVFDGGTLLFPLSYIFGDVLTEVYGYRNSRRVIWTGLAANLLMVFVFWVIAKIPAAPDWHLQQAFASHAGEEAWTAHLRDLFERRELGEAERVLRKVRTPLKVAIMGCVVNGPGEAREADVGIAGGKGKGILFKKGERVEKVGESDLLPRLLKEIEIMTGETLTAG